MPGRQAWCVSRVQASPCCLDCRGGDRTSQVPARPQCPVCPCSSTPAEPDVTRHNVTPARPPLQERRRLPQGTFEAQSHGFQARCLRFATPVTQTPRKTRFQPLARLCRVGFSPTGSQGKVSATHRIFASSSRRLTWRDPVFIGIIDPKAITCRRNARKLSHNRRQRHR